MIEWLVQTLLGIFMGVCFGYLFCKKADKIIHKHKVDSHLPTQNINDFMSTPPTK